MKNVESASQDVQPVPSLKRVMIKINARNISTLRL
jgi:hypothetical protein